MASVWPALIPAAGPPIQLFGGRLLMRFIMRFPAALPFAAGLAAMLLLHSAGSTADAVKPDPKAVDRTREIVRMLDDMHKGYVVHITDTYVKAQDLTPAARVTKKVFKHMADKGWGTGRLIDASGKPLNEDNWQKSALKKKAVVKKKAGKLYFDEVTLRDGNPVLRAATVVPAVMKQCLKCHVDAKEGDVLGA